MRALRAPGSTHGFFHATRTSCERNLFKGSFPETLDILLPGWWTELKLHPDNYVHGGDLTVRLPNGSKFIFMGLDDPEKVRGLKFSTVMVNEANQVDYKTIVTLRGRLSEEIKTVDGPMLETKMLFDLNPTVKSSWDYQAFVEGVIPDERTPIGNHAKTYRYLTINAIDNKPNLPASLFEDFESMSDEQRRRDEHGMWSEDNPSALFNPAHIGRLYAHPDKMDETVVSLDPAGTSNSKSDSTGIIVAGRGHDGKYYVLEDATMKGKPDEWIKEAERLRVKYDANWIISEKDYARDILEELISRTIPNAPVKYVESRGRKKRLRAEPIAAMYVQGLVNHVPHVRAEGEDPAFTAMKARQFHALEQQMVEFDAPSFKGSPDRVDALVYALQHLSGDKPKATLTIGRVANFMS
nr:phage terminase large subunit [Sphingomonas sp. CFBP 13706]